MTPGDGALDLARRLLASEAGGAADDGALVDAAERICTRVAIGLSRWFGPYGSLALFSRGLAGAQRNHPALADLTIASTPGPSLVGLADAARTHGARATSDGVVTVLATLLDLIGRLIGDDLAATLVEQSINMSSDNGTTTPTSPTRPRRSTSHD